MAENKNLNRRAVAIKYTEGDSAPSVVASGKGYAADRIVEAGSAADKTVYEDRELVEELARIELGLNIPSELYEVVAKVLIFVERLEMQAMRRI